MCYFFVHFGPQLSPQCSSLQVRSSSLDHEPAKREGNSADEGRVLSQRCLRLGFYADPQDLDCTGNISGKLPRRGWLSGPGEMPRLHPKVGDQESLSEVPIPLLKFKGIPSENKANIYSANL